MKEDLDRDLFVAPKWRQRLVYWLRDHIRVASEVSKNMSLELSSSFLTWFILGLTVSFPAGLYLAHLNTEKAEGLVGLTGGIAIYFQTGTTDLQVLFVSEFSLQRQFLLWFAFFASFVVKIPMWPFHTWLPDAHVEAPTAGSVILAGVLLKLAGYGFIRFSITMFPDASHLFAPMIYALSIIAIIFTSLIALVQEDMKKLIAYSSVAHMGFVTLGIFTFTIQGIEGAIIQMISHGIVSACLLYTSPSPRDS